jgi:hypothetical protein
VQQVEQLHLETCFQLQVVQVADAERQTTILAVQVVLQEEATVHLVAVLVQQVVQVQRKPAFTLKQLTVAMAVAVAVAVAPTARVQVALALALESVLVVTAALITPLVELERVTVQAEVVADMLITSATQVVQVQQV